MRLYKFVERYMNKYKSLKAACYITNISMSVAANIAPLLFLTFREMYGISYSLLGLLVLINFVTQLTVDLIFSFFSDKFNISLAVKITPVITFIGLAIFAFAPFLFPGNVYIGLVIGTIIFSASGGFVEVLISPVIAAIPADNPDSEMSKLHSAYAWGVVGFVIFATLFLEIFGRDKWMWLALLLTAVPLCAALLFALSEIPDMSGEKKESGALGYLRDRGVWLCIFAIFLGGATECTMSQWCSGYIEGALGFPKVWGDILGVAVFGLTLGLGRTLYSKRGKSIERVLLIGAIGAVICYLTAALSPVPAIGLAACALTGFCTSMLWPGSLIVASDRYPSAGVVIFAFMAAGGDLGASVGPQMIGIVTDAVTASPTALKLAERLMLTADELGMRVGMLLGVIFPLTAVVVYSIILKQKKRRS